ncbi:hypothetical protein HNP55_003364 [Paucibacter oligotrophus]|uniref:Uncharacterized protein n=1 Tax=Roseateles oligotrophus TaxID=1769250 RepID=A0A840L9H8_9BURK|nr:hypothetical protein [Roseateles oligotrophus]MBB4844820.1 hypothetical protein [Roseateles oligotrophus]
MRNTNSPEQEPPAPAAKPSAAQLRLTQLFRHSLRQGDINPLLYLLLRHRRGDTGEPPR